MPKKKLTKTRVRIILDNMFKAANVLTRDKLDYRSTSHLTMSFNAILDIGTKLQRARDRLK